VKHTKFYVFVTVAYLLCAKGIGLTETMYVSDRLSLSLRSAPDLERPALELISSDTKVDVLETQGKWARVRLEDGRTGWVIKRFLVKNVPKSLVIEHLKRQIASLKNEVETLKSKISQENQRFEVTTRESSRKRLKEISVTGIVALFVGFALGYLIKRAKTIGLLITFLFRYKPHLPQCKLCERRGFFLKVSQDGLCEACEPIVSRTLDERIPVVNDCMKLVAESNDTETRLSRCDLLIEHAEALMEYECKGIPTMEPLPSELVTEYRAMRGQILSQDVAKEVEEAPARTEISTLPPDMPKHADKEPPKTRKERYQPRDGVKPFKSIWELGKEINENKSK
jgi:SH3 domain protein